MAIASSLSSNSSSFSTTELVMLGDVAREFFSEVSTGTAWGYLSWSILDPRVEIGRLSKVFKVI